MQNNLLKIISQCVEISLEIKEFHSLSLELLSDIDYRGLKEGVFRLINLSIKQLIEFFLRFGIKEFTFGSIQKVFLLFIIFG